MALLIRRSIDSYRDLMLNHTGKSKIINLKVSIKRIFFNLDTITRDLFLIKSQIQVLAIIALYLAFVLDIGPKFMQNRKPYNLDRVIFWYNIIQIIGNSALVIIVS